MIKRGINKGYILVELILSMALYCLLTLLLLSFLLYSVKLCSRLKNNTSALVETSAALDKMCSEVRSAKSISVPSIEKGHVLIIDSSEINKNGVLEDVRITYYLDSGRKRVYRMVNGTSNLLTENIKDVNFTSEGGLLIIKITSSKGYDGNYYSLSSAVYHRVNI